MLFIRKYKQLLKFNCNNFLVINYYRHYQVFKEQNLRNLNDLSKPSKTCQKSCFRRTFSIMLQPRSSHTVVFLFRITPQKGGDPSPRSRRDTLLRLHPSHLSYLGRPPPLLVRLSASGITDSHGVTGGVYNTRERIHPDILIRDYQRFQLHGVELQTPIRTGTDFKRFAPCHHVAARCIGHCSTPVALDVRGMMI